MKKLSDKNKRGLIVAGLSVVCVALVIAISSQFKTEKPKDVMAAPSSAVSSEVSPNPDSSKPAEKTDVVIQSNEPATASSKVSGSGVSSGTKQTIQADVAKPEAPKEAPKPQGETNNSSKVPTYKSGDNTVSKPSEPKGGEKKDGKVYLPGFGWVTDTGGSGTTASDMYENGHKIGNMN